MIVCAEKKLWNYIPWKQLECPFNLNRLMDSFETSVASRLLSVLERYAGFSNTDTMIHYNIIQGILLSFASLFPTLASPGRGAVPGHRQGCPGQVMTVRWSCFLHLPHSPPHHPRHHRHHAFCTFLIHLLIVSVIMTMIIFWPRDCGSCTNMRLFGSCWTWPLTVMITIGTSWQI